MLIKSNNWLAHHTKPCTLLLLFTTYYVCSVYLLVSISNCYTIQISYKEIILTQKQIILP